MIPLALGCEPASHLRQRQFLKITKIVRTNGKTPFLEHRKWGVSDFEKEQEGQVPRRDEAAGSRDDSRRLWPRRDSSRAGRDRQRREKMAEVLLGGGVREVVRHGCRAGGYAFELEHETARAVVDGA